MDLLLRPIPLLLSLHTFQQHTQLNQTNAQQEQQRYESTQHTHFLYHLLNSKFSSDTPVQEIRREYFRLSQLYHPDKRPSQFKAHERLDGYFDRKQAELNFIKEILLDERKKSLYDKYGKNWSSIGQINTEMHKLYKTKVEKSKDFEFSEYYNREILPNTIPKVDTKIQVDPNLQVRFHSFSHSLLLHKSKHTLLSIRNNFFSLNEKSIPYLKSNLNYDYFMNNESSYSLGVNYSSLLSGTKQESVFYVKNTSVISKDDTCSVQLNLTDQLDWTTFLLEWNRRLSKNYRAKLSYDLKSSSASYPLVQLKGKSTSLHLNGWESVSLAFKKNRLQHRIQYHWFRALEYSLKYTLLHNKSDVTHPQTVRVGCNIGSDNGVSLDIEFTKGLFDCSIPIKLDVSNYKTLLSLISIPILYYVLVKPLQQWMQYKQWKQDRIQNYNLCKMQRKRVEDYLQSKESLLKEIINYEESVNGLIIQHAEYGSLKDEYYKTKYANKLKNEKEHIPSGVIDVTHQIQLMVQHSCLELEEDFISNGKSEQLFEYGFYDCAPKEPKHLTIYYLFKQRLHKVIVNDTQALRIPMAKHLIKSV